MGPLVLPQILEALRADGWHPPKASQSEGGQISGEQRRGMRTIRRIAVSVIMDNAPEAYRNPRSLRTHEWAYEELQKLSSVLGKFSFDTIVKDIEDWAYNPTTGTRRRGARKLDRKRAAKKAASKKRPAK